MTASSMAGRSPPETRPAACPGTRSARDGIYPTSSPAPLVRPNLRNAYRPASGCRLPWRVRRPARQCPAPARPARWVGNSRGFHRAGRQSASAHWDPPAATIDSPPGPTAQSSARRSPRSEAGMSARFHALVLVCQFQTEMRPPSSLISRRGCPEGSQTIWLPNEKMLILTLCVSRSASVCPVAASSTAISG